jgi:hypothetical protein
MLCKDNSWKVLLESQGSLSAIIWHNDLLMASLEAGATGLKRTRISNLKNPSEILG